MAEVTNILQEQQEKPKEYPILWWTKWFGQTIEEGQVVNYCGLPYTCKFTLDRTRYDETKVIIIHAMSFDPSDVPNLGDVKSGKKALVLNTRKWVSNSKTREKKKGEYLGLCLRVSFVHDISFSHWNHFPAFQLLVESPRNFQIKSQWTDVFTHMWSYSFEKADFVQTYFRAGRGEGSFIQSILAKPMYTIQEKNALRKELAPVAWIVSSCTSTNGRHFYINQLLKYIKVDIYGHCMKNKDWPLHSGKKRTADLG